MSQLLRDRGYGLPADSTVVAGPSFAGSSKACAPLVQRWYAKPVFCSHRSGIMPCVCVYHGVRAAGAEVGRQPLPRDNQPLTIYRIPLLWQVDLDIYPAASYLLQSAHTNAAGPLMPTTAHAHKRTHAHTHAHTRTYITRAHAHTNTHAHTHAHTHTYAHTRTLPRTCAPGPHIS